MSQVNSNLDDLMKNPKTAALFQNKALIQQLMESPDTKKLMALLNENAGGGLKDAASAAAKGDTSALTGILNQVMSSKEGAQVVSRMEHAIPKDKV